MSVMLNYDGRNNLYRLKALDKHVDPGCDLFKIFIEFSTEDVRIPVGTAAMNCVTITTG